MTEIDSHSESVATLSTPHEFLKEKDNNKTRGHLSRVKTPEGDILWLY
ncbi:MAG: hypothetical protein AAFQ74_01090 [Cyanobacteria bacterium J06623_4]